MVSSSLLNHGVIEHYPACQRGPCLGDDVIIVMESAQTGLRKARVNLHLVKHRRNTGGGNQVLEHVLVEVGHADGRNLTHTLQAGDSLKGLVV